MIRATIHPSLDVVSKLLSYDPESGILTWRESRGGVLAGSVAGSLDSNGYRCVQVGRFPTRAHQLAWFIYYGIWPMHEIDHEDGDTDNNRILNLRKADRKGQLANAAIRSDNTSGIKGVSWSTKRKRWIAQIHVDGRHIHLGQFYDKEDAAKAYAAAAQKHFGIFAKPSISKE